MNFIKDLLTGKTKCSMRAQKLIDRKCQKVGVSAIGRIEKCLLKTDVVEYY